MHREIPGVQVFLMELRSDYRFVTMVIDAEHVTQKTVSDCFSESLVLRQIRIYEITVFTA